MVEFCDIEVIVFDVLGTLVDEPSGLRAAIRDAVPAADAATVDGLVALWQQHVSSEQRRIEDGSREYADTQVIDLEAARHVADRAGFADAQVIDRITCRITTNGTLGTDLSCRAAQHYGRIAVGLLWLQAGEENKCSSSSATRSTKAADAITARSAAFADVSKRSKTFAEGADLAGGLSSQMRPAGRAGKPHSARSEFMDCSMSA